MAGHFTLTTGKDGQTYFGLFASNGEQILRGEGYSSKSAAQNGIAAVQKNCCEADRYEKKEANNGKFFFNLKAANHQIIGTSQMYASADSRDSGIESVMKNGTSTDVRDESA